MKNKAYKRAPNRQTCYAPSFPKHNQLKFRKAAFDKNAPDSLVQSFMPFNIGLGDSRSGTFQTPQKSATLSGGSRSSSLQYLSKWISFAPWAQAKRCHFVLKVPVSDPQLLLEQILRVTSFSSQPLKVADFLRSLESTRPTVTEADIKRHEDWTKESGAFCRKPPFWTLSWLCF